VKNKYQFEMFYIMWYNIIIKYFMKEVKKAYCLNRMLCDCWLHWIWLSVVRLIVMKKFVVSIMLVILFGGIILTHYNNRIDAVQEYYQIPGDTAWKKVENVEGPDGRHGFKLINAEGKEKHYAGSTTEWSINLETGECYYH